MKKAFITLLLIASSISHAQSGNDIKLVKVISECAGTFGMLAKFLDHNDSRDVQSQMIALNAKSLQVALMLAKINNLPDDFVQNTAVNYVRDIGSAVRDDRQFWLGYLSTDAQACRYVIGKF